MADDRGLGPTEFPRRWARAHDLWMAVAEALPPETPAEWRSEIEKDVYGLFERTSQHESGPDTDDLLLELALVRIQLAILRRNVHELQEPGRDSAS